MTAADMKSRQAGGYAGKLLAGALAGLLASCAPGGIPAPGDDTITLPPPIVGSVDRRFVYRLQATIRDDVAPAASVSFIEPGTLPRTVATTVTTDEGRFVLELGGRFSPRDGAVYYLEAFKGLGSNQAGFNAVRVRTLVRWQGGWQSLTSGGVTISTGTTAVAAAAQINTAQGQAVALADLMGKLAPGQADGTTPDTFTPVANLSAGDFHGAYDAVDRAIGGGLDPIASIGKANGGFYLKAGGGALGITPGTGADVGDTVTISGTTFASGGNLVLFGGATGSVTAVASDRKSIQVTVPEGATRGPVAVIVGDARSGVVDYPIYGTVRLSVSGIPGSSSAVRAALSPPSGTVPAQEQSSPGAAASFTFKGLIPGMGWTVTGEAKNSAGQAWASSRKLDGLLDPVTRLALPGDGPYEVRSGLNDWSLGLAVPAIGGTATGSF